MRKELFWSILRKALIITLAISAVLLFLQTDYFSASGRRLNAQREPAAGISATAAPSVAAEAAATLRPQTVLVRYPSGGTLASSFDGETTELAFLRFSALLGEALGSADPPEEISEKEFRRGISAGCVFIDLGAEVPLGLLSDWLGAGGGGAAAMSARTLYLGLSETSAVLCFRTPSGSFRRCATATQTETLQSRMNEFQAGTASFAYEIEQLKQLDPYTVVLNTMPTVYGASGWSARDSLSNETLMRAVGLNSFVATSYTDADGTLVLMEEGKTLRLQPDGTLNYRSTGSGVEMAADSADAAVNYAARLVLRSAGVAGGDAEIMFSGLQARDTAYTVYFDYCLAGIPVHLASGHAAEVVVSGGRVTSARVALRRYALSETPEMLLTMYRAAAIAASEGGGAMELAYLDSGDRVTCAWVSGNS